MNKVSRKGKNNKIPWTLSVFKGFAFFAVSRQLAFFLKLFKTNDNDIGTFD